MSKLTVPVKHVVKVGDRWRYRRVVLPDLRQAIGRANWTRQWPASTEVAQIETEAAALARGHDQAVRLARGEIEAAEIAEADQQAREWRKRDPVEQHELVAFLLANPSPANDYFLNAWRNEGTFRPNLSA